MATTYNRDVEDKLRTALSCAVYPSCSLPFAQSFWPAHQDLIMQCIDLQFSFSQVFDCLAWAILYKDADLSRRRTVSHRQGFNPVRPVRRCKFNSLR